MVKSWGRSLGELLRMTDRSAPTMTASEIVAFLDREFPQMNSRERRFCRRRGFRARGKGADDFS
jgi:hypothetical protein